MEVAHTNTSEKRTQPRHIRAWTISLTMCLTGSFSGRLVFLVPIIKVTTPFTPSSKASCTVSKAMSRSFWRRWRRRSISRRASLPL